MGVTYHIQGLPDDLPAGEYDTRVEYCDWVACRDGTSDLLMVVRYAGELDRSVPREERGLFSFTKED